MRRILATLAVVVALLFSSGSAWADFDDGRAIMLRADYAAAFREFRPLAEQGDAGAQFNLGLMYSRGLGVPENDAEAVKWYRKAAEQGHADAQTLIGMMYAGGLGVPKNDAEAVKWFHKAAEQGIAQAQFNLGNMYADGTGVPEDDAEAAKWFCKAAKQGCEGISLIDTPALPLATVAV